MAETKKKPFWVDEGEWERRQLPKLGGDLSSAVTQGVPELRWVTRGNLLGAWVIKDGLLLYQFYKKDRKDIYDAAQEEMERARREAGADQLEEFQRRIAAHANEELEKRPWWPTFQDAVTDVFKEHFRFHPFKMDYYREVDSWSVVMAELNTPVKWSADQYELPISKIALRVGS